MYDTGSWDDGLYDEWVDQCPWGESFDEFRDRKWQEREDAEYDED